MKDLKNIIDTFKSVHGKLEIQIVLFFRELVDVERKAHIIKPSFFCCDKCIITVQTGFINLRRRNKGQFCDLIGKPVGQCLPKKQIFAAPQRRDNEDAFGARIVLLFH